MPTKTTTTEATTTMRHALEDLTSGYGQNWTRGVLAEHVHSTDATVHVTTTGRTVAIPLGGGVPVPVLCGEIVMLATEDGPVDGRCGRQTYDGDFACPGHADERRAWMNETEAERAAWEARVAS